MHKTILVVMLVLVVWPFGATAQQVRTNSSPITPVQLEKLNKLIEKKGANVGLNDAILTALGIGDGVALAIRNLTTFDAATQRHYTFGVVIGTRHYVTTLSDGSSPRVFLLDNNLNVVVGLKTGFGLERLTPDQAQAGARETLEQFSNFADMN